MLRLTLTLLVVGLSWVFGGGFGGVITLALYVIGVLPGLPLGRALFGPSHPARIAAGALMGYGLLVFALWIPVAVGRPGPLAFVAAWAVLLVLTRLAARWLPGPLVALPGWSHRDTSALLLVLHLVPLLVGSPFARAGERDAEGVQYYRAYFTVDFVWHVALTREVARFDPHLRNPYVAREDLHYYWTYFLPPAVFASRGVPGGIDRGDWGLETAARDGWSIGRSPRDPVDAALKITAMMTALLLLAMVYITIWAATGRRWAAMAAAAVTVLAPSFEGLHALNDLRHTGRTLDYLRHLNIDAIANWTPSIRGFRVDNLPRTMWWTPQHGTSLALGLIAVLAASRWAALSVRAAGLVGLALALSVAFNPLLGAAFCAIYGGTVLWDLAARRLPLASALTGVLAVVPVGLALWWCIAAGMSEGADGLTVGVHEFARRAPFTALFLSLGGVLIPVAAGLLPSRHVPLRPAVPALLGLVIGLLLMHFVGIPDAAWVGFRAGNIILVTAGMLAARGLVVAYSRSGRVLALTFAALVFLAGVPTTAIDWFNARDLENREMGPGFLWVIPYSPEQQAGFHWIRRATARDAIVQADPIVRGRQNWTDIPTFTGRRMAGGMALPLERPHHREHWNRVHAIFTTLAPEEAHAEAAAMGIDYLWIDRWDFEAPTGPAVSRLLDRPDLFPPLYRRGNTAVLAVSPRD